MAGEHAGLNLNVHAFTMVEKLSGKRQNLARMFLRIVTRYISSCYNFENKTATAPKSSFFNRSCIYSRYVSATIDDAIEERSGVGNASSF